MTQPALRGDHGQVNFSLSPVRIAGVLIVAILALTSCSIVTTTGPTRTESRTVSGFSKVELAGSGDVTIDQTGSESLTIEAGDKVLPNLTSDVVGDTLVLGTKRGAVLTPGGRISYHLSVKDLTGLTVSGSGEVTAPQDHRRCPQLRHQRLRHDHRRRHCARAAADHLRFGIV